MVLVYRHIRRDLNEVFYVGIAKKRTRPFDCRARNKLWRYVTYKTDYFVEVVANVDSWELACELEQLLITEYGRKDMGSGTLCNLTDGGDGSINVVVSKETRKKISEKSKGVLKSELVKRKISESLRGKPSGMLGKKMTDEHKRKIGRANSIALKGSISPFKGKKHTDEAKKIIGLKGIGRPAWNKGVSCDKKTRSKISQTLKGKHGKKVIHKKTMKIYGSLKHACEDLNLVYPTEVNRINRGSIKSSFIPL